MMTAAGEIIEIAGAQRKYHRRPQLTERRLWPVILLHPWFGCWQFWQRTVEALPEFETYAIDLYSLGAGGNWQEFASPHGLARAVGLMIESLGIERYTLIGNSMGGIAGQVLATTPGNRIENLILVSTGARTVGVKPDFRRALDEWIAQDGGRAFTERLVSSLLARRPEDRHEFETFVESVVNANKAFMGAVLTNAFNLDLRSVLPEITASTLVIRGELDAARTAAHVEEVLAGVSNSKAVEIPAGGHSPQVDSASVFSRVVRDFLLA